MPTIEEVKHFWSANPLFTGEGSAEAGSRQWFEQHEKVYDSDCIADKSVYTFLKEDVAPDASVLDVGCGPGYWMRFFLRNGFTHVSACDLTPQAVELSRTSLELFQLHTDGQIITGNAEELPFAKGSMDHINCQGVIHHTPDTAQCLREFHRVLRPGGTACFSVYYKNFILRNNALFSLVRLLSAPFIGLKGRGREKMVHDAHTPDDLVRLYDGADNPIGKSYTAYDILTMTREAGLHPLAHRRFFFPARALPLTMPPWLHAFCDRTFGLMLIIRAQKPC